MSLYQRLGIVIGLLGILANVLAGALSPVISGAEIVFSALAFIQALAVIGYLLAAKRGILGLIFVWLGVGALVLSGLFGFPIWVRYVFLVLVVLALGAAIGTTFHLPMPYSRYQRLGIVISLLGILANIFMLALGPQLAGVIKFVASALIQLLAVIGYRLAAKMLLPGLIFVWLGVWALAFSGLFSFFPVTGLTFLILLVFALAASIGVTVHLPMSDTKKMAIIVGGVSGVFLIFYLILVAGSFS